jgi:hypothetical protein
LERRRGINIVFSDQNIDLCGKGTCNKNKDPKDDRILRGRVAKDGDGEKECAERRIAEHWDEDEQNMWWAEDCRTRGQREADSRGWGEAWFFLFRQRVAK